MLIFAAFSCPVFAQGEAQDIVGASAKLPGTPIPPLPPHPGVIAFVQAKKITDYKVALFDLDNDGSPEALIYAKATINGGGRPDLCGSGGCNLYVLSLSGNDYRQVTAVTVTRPPIRVLPSQSNGWHDLSVLVAGGGTRAHQARLEFDGHTYPSNPSLASVGIDENPFGRTVIEEDSASSP
ncbi:hypothetical protein NRB_36300 [Novosphingobium sp. 11B]